MGRRKAKKAEKKARQEQAKIDAQMKAEQAAYDKNLASQYWSNYTQWKGDLSQGLERDLSSARARYAAQGGMELYDIYEKDRTAKYEADLKGIESGETASFLRDYATKQGATDMNDFYTNTFGQDMATSETQQPKKTSAQGLMSAFRKGGFNAAPEQGKSSFWG